MTTLAGNISDVVRNPHDAAAITAVLPVTFLVIGLVVAGVIFMFVVRSAGKKSPPGKDDKKP